VREDNERFDSDLTVDAPFRLKGMVEGHTEVTKNGVLVLEGMCCAGLTLEPGSEVQLRGMVIGDVINRGGELAVYGMINGRLVTEAGSTYVDPVATVRGGIHTSD
jgi:cytoskeletal protein CcmA (bactofilin family)